VSQALPWLRRLGARGPRALEQRHGIGRAADVEQRQPQVRDGVHVVAL
jgi:hypothetical protein